MPTVGNYERFAENLVFLRKKYAMPQKTLAALSGISLPILRLTERGEVIPRITEELVARLCAIFNVTEEELLNEELHP